ncbi:Cupredoxin [Jimgerdemannia flammicorona]|uniref:Cupredoxin n=2 Tax=Jimgerdemannia flammicorona TaxID=994334 RepID=A0A433Q3A5_9FUNG|nr:Cupredoxin [Jimgerdemannia flammicorona]
MGLPHYVPPFFFLAFALVIQSVSAARREYNLTFTTAAISPDCHSFKPSTPSTLLINGQFPGPTIHAERDDTLVIRVQNRIIAVNNEMVTLHFHGIRQRGTPLADGVPFLTQYPVSPGEDYVHEFHAQIQAGTYFYHSHVGFQGVSAFGPLLIYDYPEDSKDHDGGMSLPSSPFEYDEERIFMLSDWWHKDRHAQEQGVLSENFTWIGEPDSLLINGRTIYNASFAESDECKGYDVTTVDYGKVYRFRIMGSQTLETLAFGIGNHTLTIIEIDGHYIEPVETSYLEVASGQRYSVLFYANQSVGNYYVHTDVRWRAVHPQNGIAIVQYSGATDPPKNIVPDLSQLPSFPKEYPQWISSQFKPFRLSASHKPLPLDITSPAREVVLTTSHISLPSGVSVWAINGVAYEMPKTPILLDILSGTRSTNPNYTAAALGDGYDVTRKTYPIRKGEFIDLIFQNTVILPGNCEAHPWHIHGHFHWEVAYGSGMYDPSVRPQDGNPNVTFVTDPFARDTSLVYPTSHAYFDVGSAPVNETKTPVGCGWKKIRIVADNPGVWMVHCHITAHMSMGMQIVLEEAVEEVVATVRGKG